MALFVAAVHWIVAFLHSAGSNLMLPLQHGEECGVVRAATHAVLRSILMARACSAKTARYQKGGTQHGLPLRSELREVRLCH